MSDDQEKKALMADAALTSPLIADATLTSPMLIHTPNLVRRRRNEELCNNLPVPTTFGVADSDYLKNSIYQGKDIIFLPLNECVDNYFQDPNLKKLAEITLPVSKPKTQKEPTKPEPNLPLPPVYMFFVCVGTKEAYNNMIRIPFNMRSPHQKNLFINSSTTYTQLLIKFLMTLFKNSEKDVLEKTYNKDDIITVTLFARSSHTNKNTGRVTYKDYLIAAASFVLDNEPSCLLVWLGVTKKLSDDFNRPKEFKKSEFDNFQFKYRIGTFLLNICQIVKSVQSQRWVPLICQVFRKASDGPMNFYKKQYFLQLPKSHELVYQQLLYREEHIIKAKELTWMAVFHPLKFMLMFEILEASNHGNEEDLIDLILERGNIFFLTPKPKFVFDQSTIENRLKTLYDTMQFSSKQEYILNRTIKDTLETEVGESLEWCIDYSFNDHKMLLGSIHVLQKFFIDDKENTERPIFFLDFHKLRSQLKDRSNFFFVMSKILYGNEVYHEMVRLYFYFIYKSLSQLDPDHVFFVEFMPAFSNIIMERTYLAPEDARYGASLIMEYLEMPNDPDLLYDDERNVKPEYYKLLLRLLSESFMKHKFTGHWHDITILSAMLDIDIYILECQSEDISPLQNDYMRNWMLKLHLPIHNNTNIFNFNKTKDTNVPKRFIAKVNKYDYVVLSLQNNLNRKIIELPNYDGETYIINNKNLDTELVLEDSPVKNSNQDLLNQLRQFISNQLQSDSTQGLENNFEQYLQLRRLENFTKLIDLSGDLLDKEDEDYLHVGPMFTFIDFLEAKIEPDLILPIVRILDPWKQLVDANVFPIRNFYTFRDLMTYRPQTWLRDQAILGFIRWLNSDENLSQDYICIDPATFSYIMLKRSRIDEFLKFHGLTSKTVERYSKILILLYIDHHYIIVEIDIPKKKVKDQNITCLIADPLHQSIEFLINQVMKHHVHLFIDAIFDNMEIIYINAHHSVKQQNNYDCGVICMQRLLLWKKYKTVSIHQEMEDYRVLNDTKLFRLFALSKIVQDNLASLSSFIMQQQNDTLEGNIRTMETDNNSASSQNENANIFYTSGLEDNMEIDESLSNQEPPAEEKIRPVEEKTVLRVSTKRLSGKNIIIEPTSDDENENEVGNRHEDNDGNENEDAVVNDNEDDDDGGNAIEDAVEDRVSNDHDDDGTISEDEDEAHSNTVVASIHSENVEADDEVVIATLLNTTSINKSKEDDDEEYILSDSSGTNKKRKPSSNSRNTRSKSKTARAQLKTPPTRSQMATTRSKSTVRKSLTLKKQHINYAPAKKPKNQSQNFARGALNSKTAEQIELRKKKRDDYVKGEIKRLDTWFPINGDVQEIDFYENNPYYFVDKYFDKHLPDEKGEIRRDEARFKCKLYKPCQLGTERAKNEVTRLIEADLEKCRKQHAELSQKIENWIDKLKEDHPKTKKILEAETKLQSIETKIVLLNWELKWQPVFLPYDSIYALRARDSNHHNNEREFYAVVQNPDGSFREKLISKEWLKENLDNEFFTKFLKADTQMGWVMFNQADNDLLQLRQSGELLEELHKKNCLPIYQYKPAEDDDEILIIRASLEFEFPYQAFKVSSYKWAVATKSRSTESRMMKCNIYSDCTQDLLKEAIGADFLMLLGESIQDAYINEFNLPGTLSAMPHNPHVEYNVQRKRYIDSKDKKDPTNSEPVYCEAKCGFLEQRQYFYFDLSTFKTKYYINVSSTQICGIVWKQSDRQYYGLERRIKSDGNFFYKKVPLEDSWVKENINGDLLKIIKSKAVEDHTKFFKIPIGDSRPIQTSKDIKKNPVIEFQEDGKNTCVFTSICSALYFMKFEDVSIQIDDYKLEFLKSEFYERFYNIMGVVTKFIQEKTFHSFKSKYKVTRIGCDNKIDIIEDAKKYPQTLFHVVLRSSDGAESHAVCIYNNWIFDGNFTNALSLTKDNLTKACDSEFIGIHYGYMYTKIET